MGKRVPCFIIESPVVATHPLRLNSFFILVMRVPGVGSIAWLDVGVTACSAFGDVNSASNVVMLERLLQCFAKLTEAALRMNRDAERL